MSMKILFISLSDPRSTNHGGEQRFHFLWEGLKKLGDVYTVVPVGRGSMERKDENEKIYWVSLERRYSLTWFVQRLLNKTLLGGAIPPVYSAKRIWKMGVPKPDVCVVRPASSAMSLKLWDVAPTCVDMDDIPLAEFDIAHKGRLSLSLRLQRMVLAKIQKTACEKGARVWIADEAEFKRFPGVPVSFVPNIPVPPLPDFKDELGANDTLFFIGYLAHGPNQVALDWFFTHIWQGLKARFPQLKFEIVGGGLPERYKGAWSKLPDVKLHGFVKDLRPCYRKALAILTPMQIGSGTCLKVLECLRMGRPLISTQQGLRGIRPEYRNPEHGIFPFEDLSSLESALEQLLATDRIALQNNAVKFVQMRNSQEFIDATVKKDIECCCAK